MTDQLVSSTDLKAFIDDIERSIDKDDSSDYKKIVLYLFNFTNSSILNKKTELLGKLLDTILLVFDKKRFLLDSQLSHGDIKSIYGSVIPNQDMLFYEWSLFFCLFHIQDHNLSILVINDLKLHIINTITLVSLKLNNFKFTLRIRTLLIKFFEDNLTFLFGNFNTKSSLVLSKLFVNVHLFSILNDYGVYHKLNLFNYELKFESFTRKLWFLLCEIRFENMLNVINDLKAICILNLTNHICLDKAVKWDHICLLLGWNIEHIRNYKTTNQNLDKTVTISILKLFKFCVEHDITETFMSYLNFKHFFKNIANSLPTDLIKTLHLINFYYHLNIGDYNVMNSYQISAKSQYISAEFSDYELESIRLELKKIFYSNNNDTVFELLSFITGSHNNNQKIPEFNYSQWLNNVKLLLREDTNSVRKLENYSLYTLTTALGYFPCLLNGDFNFKVGECSKCCNSPSSKQIYNHIWPERKLVFDSNLMTTYYNDIICGYFLKENSETLENDELLCSNYLLAVARLFSSFNPPKNNLENDMLFKFLMKLLSTNNNRDIRILCTRIIPLYLIQPKDKLLDMNFKLIFKYINSISFSMESRRHFGESTIKALVELAIISNGEWLCVLFIKLIDLFGEDNEQHVNYVHNGFLCIASAKTLTPYKLLSPFLPSIAERIIKKPKMFSKITDLLGISKKYFLYRTKDYTTPRFLEYYKYDFIQEIADASNISKWKLIAKNLSRIIATYLLKDDTINEEYIINVLSNVSPEYKSISMNELISNVGELTWFVLLQIQINEENNNFMNKERIYNALNYIAKVSVNQKGIKISKNSNKFDYIKYLLGEHVLELVQRFSENIHQIKGNKPFLEKVGSLRAIQFLIEENIESVTTALGQISTCLQASVENSDFELLALNCWYSLVKNLPSEHLLSLIDIVISLVFQKFKILQNSSKEIAIEILKRIFKEIHDKHNKYSLYFLSIPFIENIQDYNPISDFKIMKPASRLNYFQEFTRRLKTSNKYVVQQALDDLINYTSNYQLNCQNEYFKDPSLENHVSELVKTLLDTSAKFVDKSEHICTSCAKVLSIIGALDTNRFSFKSIKKQLIVVNDFLDYKENCDFLVDFIENKVIKIFWASNDPVKQLFSAYSMQKFLQVMKLDSTVLTSDSLKHSIEIWNMFSEIAKSTLAPLLSSKYISPVPKYEPLVFPYYKSNMKYENWLINLTSNLLKRPLLSVFEKNNYENTSKEVIFRTCVMLIRDQDISLCQYLLKYVSLSHVVNGNPEILSDIKVEFLEILYMDLNNLSLDQFELLKKCYQSIFEVLDYFNEWVSSASQYLNDFNMNKQESFRLKKNIEYANSFLESIPMNLIATKSAECDSYERTILYLEKCYRDGRVGENYKVDNLSIVTTLQRMYSNINDFDALSGVLKKFSTNNLQEKLSTFQYNGNWSLAQESFHVLSEVAPDQKAKIDSNTKLLESLSNHGLYEEVLSNLATKVDLNCLSEIPLEWSSLGLLASIVSSDLHQINKWLFITNSIGKPKGFEFLINYHLAKSLTFLQVGENENFMKCINNIYQIVGKSLTPSLSSSFSRNSYLMNMLHIVYDYSLIALAFFKNDETLKKDNDLIIKSRLHNINQEFDTQWNVLSIHKVANMVTKDIEKVSDILLDCSKLARINSRFDMSIKSIMKAMALDDQEANIEYSDLLWAEGKQTEAIKSLSQIILDDSFKSKKKRAQAQLKYAEWLDHSNHSSSATTIAEYMKVFKVESAWEKPYYALGKYYSKIMESKSDLTGYYEHQIIRHFLKALALGNTYIFEALPKLITIWLDFAQRKDRSREAERKLNQIIFDIEKYVDNIQVYVWYTALTQILSRIVHNHSLSSKILSIVVSKIIITYPRHALWYVLSHLNSNESIRRERISTILQNAQSKDENLSSMILKAKDLFQSLIKIANFKIPKKSTKKMSLSADFKVSNLVNPYNALVIPVRSNLEIRLPASGSNKFNAFPRSSSITFDGFDDTVNIFHSLQMPRQVTIRGTDYRAYRLMIKKDDTRKDAKVVEFTTMINRLLVSSTEARKRSLSIANYSVIPLAENMGVIEFVHNVATMKSVIYDQRKRMGQVVNERKIFMKLDEAQKSTKKTRSTVDYEALSNLISIFEDICTTHKPVLHHWFINQFSDPISWYTARTLFTRSSAVMSVVGYIIGLGDRHCENILFFRKNGTVLHIDFDCLFEKGRTLPTPEIVPFRLTQNIIDAMGICGIEGVFRIACEVVGTLIRENEAPLMNILETLLYDPLLDWKTSQNPEEHLRKVRRKIRGLVDEKEGLPMNIHGQIDVLIQEASSIENLSQMYGGWAPYV